MCKLRVQPCLCEGSVAPVVQVANAGLDLHYDLQTRLGGWSRYPSRCFRRLHFLLHVAPCRAAELTEMTEMPSPSPRRLIP